MPLELVEVCLIANLQSIGPIYVADTSKEIFNLNTGNLLAARLIITAGMGNSASPTNKLHGPVPIPELEMDVEYEGYYLITEMAQQPAPKSPFSTGKGSFIVCVVIPADVKKDYRPFELQIENIIKESVKEIDFGATMTGFISDEIKEIIKTKLDRIYIDIEEAFALAQLFEGNSLFDIGLIATLPENISRVVKKIIMYPRGLPINDINDNNILKTLELAGLVVRENRDGLDWIIPR
ncbi:MAG: hypothetical protein GPJ54_07690 [Candidatus Heimdallarchaeota archaeon]|nr:hypothetical protein [Candidatus Heimdallarchaeota archaeon]